MKWDEVYKHKFMLLIDKTNELNLLIIEINHKELGFVGVKDAWQSLYKSKSTESPYTVAEFLETVYKNNWRFIRGYDEFPKEFMI